MYNKGLQGVKLFEEGGYRDGTLAWNGSKEIRQDQINSFMAEVPIIYRNQPIDLQSKSMGWFLYDRDLRHERVNGGERLVCIVIYVLIFQSVKWVLFVWPYASFWFSCIVTSIFVYFLFGILDLNLQMTLQSIAWCIALLYQLHFLWYFNFFATFFLIIALLLLLSFILLLLLLLLLLLWWWWWSINRLFIALKYQ